MPGDPRVGDGSSEGCGALVLRRAASTPVTRMYPLPTTPRAGLRVLPHLVSAGEGMGELTCALPQRPLAVPIASSWGTGIGAARWHRLTGQVEEAETVSSCGRNFLWSCALFVGGIRRGPVFFTHRMRRGILHGTVASWWWRESRPPLGAVWPR